MTNDDVFNSAANPDTSTNHSTPPNTQPDASGVDKRLKDKDDFINQLKSELAEIRKDLGQKVNAENELKALRDEMRALRTTPKPESRETQTPELATVDGDKIRDLINQTITEREKQHTAAENVAEANSKTIDFFGDEAKAKDAVRAKATALGISMDDLKVIAAKSPSAFLSLILPPADSKNGAPPAVHNTVRTEGNPGGGGQPKEGTKPYFEKMRKEHPKLYWSPVTQNQIMKARTTGTYDIT